MDYKKFEKNIIKILGHCEGISDPEIYYLNIQDISRKIDQRDDFIRLNNVLEGLSSSDRLKIVYTLVEKDRCSCEFQGILQKSQPAVSRDIKKLEEIGMIRGWKKGNFIHYSLVKPVFDEFLQDMKNLFGSIQNWFGSGFN